MRSVVVPSMIVTLGMLAIPMLAQVPTKNIGCPSSIQVELPLDDIEIALVESNEGMVLIARCQDVSVKSQRLYLGDGRTAVLFEASNDGLFTPNGNRNAAAIEFKKGQTISVPKEKSERWGANRGEVYLQTAALKFIASE